jgi:hypothetical protein
MKLVFYAGLVYLIFSAVGIQVYFLCGLGAAAIYQSLYWKEIRIALLKDMEKNNVSKGNFLFIFIAYLIFWIICWPTNLFDVL